MTLNTGVTQTPTLHTHGPTSDGGLEAFLRAAESVALYGQIDLIGGDQSGVIAMAAGQVILEGAQTAEQRNLAIRAWQRTFSTIAASPTGAYRCGPLLNHPNADRLATASVSELLGAGPARRSTDPAPAESPLPQRVAGQHHPVDTSAPVVADALPQRPVETPRIASSQFVSEPPVSPAPVPLPAPAAQVAAPPPAAASPAPPAPSAAPESNTDPRPMRASQLRKILNSADPSSGDETARVLNEPEEATPSRRSALRSIIKNLASN